MRKSDLAFLGFFLSFLIAPVALAVDLRLGIPGSVPPENPSAFISNLYEFALMISALLGFGAVVYGGILYTFAGGNTGRQSEGREWIQSALLGLLLLLGAVIIFRVINPGIIDLRLPPLARIPAVAGPSPRLIGYSGCGPANPCPSDEIARLILTQTCTDPGNPDTCIKANKGNCTYLAQTDCTSFDYFPQEGIDGLVNMKRACDGANGGASCDFVVTGGTEFGHKSHGGGKPIADVRTTDSVNNYVFSQIGNRSPTYKTWYDGADGNQYYYETNHWHICFGGTCPAKPTEH